MKLLLAFSTVAFATSTLFVHAQEGFSFGLKGMPQNTWLLNQDDSDSGEIAYQRTIGYAFGAAFQYNIGPAAGIEVDFLYSKQGQQYEFKTAGGTVLYEGETELTYLKIPVLFSFSSDPTVNTQFYGNIGPQFSLVMDADRVLDEEELVEYDDGTEYKEAFTSPDISAVLTLGAQFNLSDELFLRTGLRLDYGLTDAEEKELEIAGLAIYDEERAKTVNGVGALEIGLFYRFGAAVVPTPAAP